jgi:uncharacterized protein (TIGR03437 family)
MRQPFAPKHAMKLRCLKTALAIATSVVLMSRLDAQATIRTIIGQDWVFPSDIANAKDAPLGRVQQLAVDVAGNLYIADADNEMVFRVSPTGSFSIIAGNGFVGFSGDGGPAINASLNTPAGVAVDKTGNIYIADSRNHRVRQITTDGKIKTVAGTGVAGYSGDGGLGTNAKLNSPACVTADQGGNVYILDYGNLVIRRLSPAGVITTFAGNTRSAFTGDGGPATNASFNNPGQILAGIDGALYVADTNNNRIRKIAGGNITTVAGNGDPTFVLQDTPALLTPIDGPSGLAMGVDGTLFFTDRYNNRIRKLTPSNLVTTVAGSGDQGSTDGLALQASFRSPFGLVLDGQGSLYVADYGNKAVRKLILNNVSTFAGNGEYRPLREGSPATTAFLFNPTHVATDAQGNTYVTDTDNARVVRVDTNGVATTIAGTRSDGTSANAPCATNGQSATLNFPSGVAVDPDGSVFFSDFGPDLVYKLTRDGRICVYAGGGSSLSDGGPATNASLSNVLGIALDSSRNLFIADSGHNRIRRVAPDGTITTFAGNGTEGFSGDGGLATSASLREPHGVAVDSNDNVYIADRFNNRVRLVTANCLRFNGDCTISTIAGNGQAGFSGDGGPAIAASIWSPWDVAVDSTGSVLIADFENNRIRKVVTNSTTGVFEQTITTIVGTGATGYFGDGGPATSAILNNPTGIAVAKDGTIIVVDQGNNRVRAISTTSSANEIKVFPSFLSFTSGVNETALVSVFSTSPGLPFSINVSGQGATNWLQVSPIAASTPVTLFVKANGAALQAGTYTATISIRAGGGQTQVVNINVILIVNTTSPNLLIQPASLSFNVNSGGAQSAVITLSNSGSAPLSYTLLASSTGWLQVISPTSGRLEFGALAVILTATAGALAPGTYAGSILITTSNGGIYSVLVQLTVSAGKPNLVLSQSGLTFNAVDQGGIPASQSFWILNSGVGAMPWTATSTASWISLSSTAGIVGSPGQLSVVNVAVNPAQLGPGTHYGQIQVLAPGASTSFQVLTVLLNISPTTTNPDPQLAPTGLIFIGGADTSPSSQTVLLTNTGTKTLAFTSTATYFDGGNWLSFIPNGAIMQPGQTLPLTVQANFSNLTPGTVKRASLTFAFGGQLTRTLNVYGVVTGAQVAPFSAHAVSDLCFPILIQPTTLTDTLHSLPTGGAVSIAVRVTDSCGALFDDSKGALNASFTNGDPVVSLVYVGDGNWTGTWTPSTFVQSTYSVQIDAVTDQSPTTRGTTTFPVIVQQDKSATLTYGTVNAASGRAGFIAPGSLISIYGANLADAQGSPSTVPFPTTLNGVQVLLGGKPIPLRFVDTGLLNAQVPFELTAGMTPQLVIVRGLAVSVPQQMSVGLVDPAVYTRDGSGTGAGLIANPFSNSLITADNPPLEGDIIVIYANGLGAVEPALPTGTPAPIGTLTKTTNPLTATIGDVQAEVQFAGLAPGFPDLYQVNVVVPCHSLKDVPVVLSIGGRNSPPVKLPRPGPPAGTPGLQCASN